jgi:hypothetical protein
MSCFRFIFLLSLISILGCENDGIKHDPPECIKNKILEYQNSGICDSGASVTRFDFQGKQAFVFSPGICGADMSSPIYDSDCNKICELGGLQGIVTCEGVNFEEHATNEVTIWEN